MTRDSAAVATLDDRRRRCPISAASNVVDDASTLMTNSTTMSGSSSNDDVGGGDEGGSLKSSSEVSTTTSCCGGSSSSSRSGSDDDDSATVTRLSSAIDDSCSTTIKTPTIPPSLHKQMEDENNGDKDSSSSSHSDEAAASSTPTSIGGRLTFYKDGKFIFQLAAHHQQNPYNNSSALTSPCRWVPVPTVIQQHKNNVKCIGEWSQHQKNKTIWPYLVTNTASDSKSPQPIQQSQSPTVRIGERKQQKFQHRTTPPPLSLITGAVNTATHAGGIVIATTTNIARRPSRKCSTIVAVENVTDFQHQLCQPPTQSRGLPRRSQQHQHQAFMMVATDTIKVQRRLLSLPKKQRLWCQRKRKSMTKNSMLQELKPPKINLECVVRNLWCRRHTTELLLRRQLSINNSGDNVAAANSTVLDVPPVVSRHVAVSSASIVDSTCSNTGSSKRRSMVSPSPTTATPIPVTATTITLSNKSGNSSPHKKYKLGHQHPAEQILLPQRRLIVDKNVKKTIPQPPTQTISTNDHSITAILSSGATGAKRFNGSSALSVVMDVENCVITTPTSTSTILSPHKNLNTPSPAPLSLLRTLLKSPSGESGSPPITASTNGVGYRQNTNGSRKRSSLESTVVSSLPPINVAAVKVENGLGTSAIAIPSVGANTADNTSAILTALHQLPTIHHPAAEQLAAAGYFNVLYHQAAMAAAMAYQTHTQLPQTLPKSQPPPLLSSQFSTTSGANSTWQRQLNRQPPLLHPSEAIVGSGVNNATITSSASTVVAPYSSPLIAATVNGSSLLPPATPSPPPSLMLHPHPVHPRHLLLHHQQQYQPAPMVQQQLSSFYRQQGSSVKERTGVAIGTTEYGDCIEENNSEVVATLDEESSSSADCMPLNLSKDSIAENVSGTSPTARVR